MPVRSRPSIDEGAAGVDGPEESRCPANLFGGSTTEFVHPTAARLASGSRRPSLSEPSRPSQLRVEELETANRRKDECLALLAHEFRNPLASIHNAVCLLNSPMGDTLGRQRAQALIARQVQRMTRLVEDILEISRLIIGRGYLQCERLDLRIPVGNAIETLEPDIRLRHHHLSVALPEMPVWLQGDPDRLEQVFVNLLANASKYTDPGGELAVQMQTHDGQAIVRVRDSGIGIAANALQHIFDLFKQADNAMVRPREGLGIGLALVRSLVELHGGGVTALSAGPGQGSEFAVRLPLEV
jgi:signal transduction histidine kinase